MCAFGAAVRVRGLGLCWEQLSESHCVHINLGSMCACVCITKGFCTALITLSTHSLHTARLLLSFAPGLHHSVTFRPYSHSTWWLFQYNVEGWTTNQPVNAAHIQYTQENYRHRAQDCDLEGSPLTYGTLIPAHTPPSSHFDSFALFALMN